MNVSVTTNAGRIAARWEARARAFGPEQRATQDRIRSVILAESRRILAVKIYAKPIPRSGTGRPQWTRTQELYQSEKAEIRGGDVVLRNTASHAARRRDLKQSQIRSPGIEEVRWQEEALANKRGAIREFYHTMNLNILKAGGT